MDITSQNIANVQTTHDSSGKANPYRRRILVFKDDGTLAVTEDTSPPKLVLDPGHPDANAAGLVAMPNIDLNVEEFNATVAARQYEFALRLLHHLWPEFVEAGG
jgi:flagellar basal-body rod protein FlgC